MTLDRAVVQGVIDTYLRAWETQDSELILEVFTESAVYHERVLQPPSIVGHAGIRRYWEEKVQRSQANIECELLSLYVDGTTAIAEWEATFDDREDGFRKRMLEVAILDFEGDRISHLREYWASERLEPLSGESGEWR
jgi:ketosteroid isomerase-like protein